MIRDISIVRNKIFILAIIIFWGCDKKETLKKYYDNGNVMAEVEMIDGKKNGRHVEYFENGDTMSVSYWKDGLQNGEARFFYENGQLESISHWKDDKSDGEGIKYYENGQLSEVFYRKNGILEGPFKWYYENAQLEVEGFFRDSIKIGTVIEYYDSGELMTEKHFINFKGEQTYTGGIEYNKDGSIKNESIRVDTKAEKDTINLGEELKLKVTLKKPFFNLTKLIVGPYDDKFNLEDTTKLQTIPMENHEVIYSIKPQTKGQQYIRGYISNYEILDKKKNITKESHTYFEYPYFVK